MAEATQSILETLLSLISEREGELFAIKKEKTELEGTIRQIEADIVTLNEKALHVMQETGCESTAHAGVTYALRKVPPKVIITDEGQIPEEFFRIKKEINKALINERFAGGETIPGTSLDNGGYTIAKRSSK